MVSFLLDCKVPIRVLIVNVIEGKGCILFSVEKAKCVVYIATII